MTALLLTILLSVVSAVGYALAAVAQQRVATAPRRPGVRLPVLTTPLWWVSVALNVAAAGLHVVALRYGSLAVVQPLGALTVVFALPAGALFAGRRVTAREWRGAAATLAGLALLLLAVGTGTGTGTELSVNDIGLLSAVAALAVTLLVGGGDGAAFRGLRLAAASGIVFALGSASSQVAVLRMGSPTADDAVTMIFGVGAVALSVAGMMLGQSAYRFGLGAQLATATIVNPAFSAAIAVLLLGQSLSPAAAAVAAVAAALAARGVVLLTTAKPATAAAPAGRATPAATAPLSPTVLLATAAG